MLTRKIKAESRVGESYGDLKVLSVFHKSGRAHATCLCACGEVKDIRLDGLVSGTVVSCGCHKDRILGERSKKHGKLGTNTYSSWQRMKDRCTNPNNTRYHLYGGRGITVCERWLESFENFCEDMGDCPDGKSIDRINPELGYDVSNCRWADTNMQAFNKRPRESLSNITGVSYDRLRNKWYAYIGYGGENLHLGRFDLKEDAIKARLDAEILYYGEYKVKDSSQ